MSERTFCEEKSVQRQTEIKMKQCKLISIILALYYALIMVAKYCLILFWGHSRRLYLLIN